MEASSTIVMDVPGWEGAITPNVFTKITVINH